MSSRTLIKTIIDPLPMVSSAIETSDLVSRWESQTKGPITVFGVPRSLWKSPENDSRLTKKKSPMNSVSDLVLIGETSIVNRLGLKFNSFLKISFITFYNLKVYLYL